MMAFDPECTISDIFKRIEENMGRQLSADNFKLVLESPDLKEPVPLGEDAVLKDYITSDGVRIFLHFIYFLLL